MYLSMNIRDSAFWIAAAGTANRCICFTTDSLTNECFKSNTEKSDTCLLPAQLIAQQRALRLKATMPMVASVTRKGNAVHAPGVGHWARCGRQDARCWSPPNLAGLIVCVCVTVCVCVHFCKSLPTSASCLQPFAGHRRGSSASTFKRKQVIEETQCSLHRSTATK